MACACGLLSLTGCYNTGEPRENVLKIYNWADYIDEDVLAEFPEWYKEQTGEDIRIVYQTFDINEIMLTQKLNAVMRILMWYVLRNISSSEC